MSTKSSLMTPVECEAFCRQMATLAEAGVLGEDALNVLAEESSTKEEADTWKAMAEKVYMGTPLPEVLREDGRFPEYMIETIRLGEETGSTDTLLKALAVYYDRENRQNAAIRSAVRYPLMLSFVILIILFVILTQVMPVFKKVLAQLGTSLAPGVNAAISIGSVICGAALVIEIVCVVLFYALKAAGGKDALSKWVANRMAQSKSAKSFAMGKYSSVFALSLKSGMTPEDAMNRAAKLANDAELTKKTETCIAALNEEGSLAAAFRKSQLYTGLPLQMLQVGGRAGRWEESLENLADQFTANGEEELSRTLDRLEPALAAVLSLGVGLLLLAVMLPLLGMLAAVG